MNKLSMALIGLSLIAVFFTACKKKDDTSSPSIYGTWEGTTFHYDIEDLTVTPHTHQTSDTSYAHGKSETFEFKSNNTLVTIDYTGAMPKADSGKFAISGNTINFLKNDTVTSSATFTLDNKNLTLKFDYTYPTGDYILHSISNFVRL